MNKILASDSYKFSHFLQYPLGTEYVSSYIEPRGVSNDFPLTNEIVNMGMNAFIHQYLNSPITRWDVREAEEIAKAHGVPFNKEGWNIILNEYGGYLPLHIQALPEGMVIPRSTCQVQVVNTDPRLPWLTSFVETALLRAIWYPSTVATLSREVKKVFKRYLDTTSDNPEVINFMLHDFGARGVSSGESAALGGMAHLVNFMGTDTLEAIKLIRDVYAEDMAGFSVPAAEHSTITSWLEFGGEEAAFDNMINQFAGDGKIYATVSDSYDIYHAVDNIWGKTLKDKVLAKGGRLVVRPDSGVPEDVVLYCVQSLGKTFGYTTNSKGYKVLNPAVRVIQGDGVNHSSIQDILKTLLAYGWSSENVVFGMGGALLQKVNRDSLKYAMKASAICVNGKWHDVFKNPVTDAGKASKLGRLSVTKDLSTLKADLQGVDNLLETVWYLGKLGDDRPEMRPTFAEIRERAKV